MAVGGYSLARRGLWPRNLLHALGIVLFFGDGKQQPLLALWPHLWACGRSLGALKRGCVAPWAYQHAFTSIIIFRQLSYVDQTGLELQETHLPLPPQRCD